MATFSPGKLSTLRTLAAMLTVMAMARRVSRTVRAEA